MAKKAMYAAEAERLYLVDNCTIAEIASRLRLGEKTIRIWKEEGQWDQKRAALMEQRQSLTEELYAFTRALLRSVKEDLDKGVKVDPGRMYALTQLIGKLDKVRTFEQSQQEGKKTPKDMSNADVVKLINQALGIEAPEEEKG
ncbi:MAG TPA: hypothetical protein PLV42_06955 [bacterium]|nr:hypothetical protein [bacterium]